MPNIVGVMREEIIRLSRREIKKQTSTLQKMSVIYRRDIAALKRQVATLERVSKQTAKCLPAPNTNGKPGVVCNENAFRRERVSLDAPSPGLISNATWRATRRQRAVDL